MACACSWVPGTLCWAGGSSCKVRCAWPGGLACSAAALCMALQLCQHWPPVVTQRSIAAGIQLATKLAQQDVQQDRQRREQQEQQAAQQQPGEQDAVVLVSDEHVSPLHQQLVGNEELVTSMDPTEAGEQGVPATAAPPWPWLSRDVLKVAWEETC